METQPFVSNRNMLKELIELRHVKSERESILRTNQYYIAQVSQMEIKISELKANLQAKESEIFYLSQKLLQAEEQLSVGPVSNKQLESQLLMLQSENQHLKLQLQEAGEVSQLKIQLEYALKMKEIFEEKYREAKTQLLTNKSCGFDGEQGFKMEKKKIEDELENTKRKMAQLQNQFNILSAENEELVRKFESSEREDGKEKISFEGKSGRKTPKCMISPEPSKFLAITSSTNYSEPSKIITRSIDLSTKSASQLSKTIRTTPSKIIRNHVPLAKTVKNEVAQYCPSFMRNKKSDNKVTPTPSVKKSTSSFPDDFPNEDEF